MAEFPYLRGAAQSRTAIDKFIGLDRRERAAENAVRAGKNLSLRAFPSLTPREPRKKIENLTACTDLFAAHGHLIWTSGGNLYVDGEPRGGVEECPHQMAVMGKQLILFPEKQYLTLGESGSLRQMEARVMGSATFTDHSIALTQSAAFEAGDGVTIARCTQHTENNKTAVIRAVEGSTLIFSENCFVSGEERNVTITRKVPDLDFICEKDNRLWGVHDNAVCCSALGNPFNWMVYEGLATDGWQTEVGTGGKFTGIAAVSSHVLCFKEDCVHKIYGTKPSNFQVQVSQIPGVQAGCARSIRNVGEILYWWAREGLMAYGGGIPDRLSAPLGDTPYEAVKTGVCGHTLYLAGKRAGRHELLCYDLERGIFLPEDDCAVVQFAQRDGVLYFAEQTALWMAGAGEEAVCWMAEFGPFRTQSPTVLTGMTVLAECPHTSTLQCAVRTDRKPWRTVWAGECQGQVRIPIVNQRGQRLWMRLSGRGPATIQGILRTQCADGVR